MFYDHHDRNFFVGFAAFIIVGASAVYGYSNGYLSRDAHEIVQDLAPFAKCEVSYQTVTRQVDDDEYANYSVKLLDCELSDQQKSSPETMAQANELLSDLKDEVWRTPEIVQNEVEKQLYIANAQKNPQRTIDEIAVNALEFENCEVNNQEKTIACELSRHQTFIDESGQEAKEKLAIMNLKLSQLNDPSKVKERMQEINQQRSAGMEQLRENVSRLFGIK